MTRFKMSPTQQEVVALMRDGWELGVREGLDSRCWLQRNGVGAGGESKSVGIGTYAAVAKRGVFKVKKIGYPVTSYVLADVYRTGEG
ncbi:hypothetical protein [Xanthomonas vasicola]|uniref:Uncharacterized protein n=1 Tax=Xanthomonas vasicola pv. vasculorum NCPPB 890 TaxID=1184265 RepID=A0A836P4K1_XANVA|nr:hypothetical protein [Xanthomonas vasicola]MBV6747277.1 hypothetical protein [Xanthomonas vasicola pv. vasculorum NCPPB 890]MBV6892787.1 hypothetical protein [Xanthomonas vasicola pv. vasculorum]MDO6960538.1 hypothetical protein [Xanthomonas vasicola]